MCTETNKKHCKFRAMTIGEHCFDSDSRTMCQNCEYGKPACIDCEYRYLFFCNYSDYNKINREQNGNKPYKTKDGKYILIEVEE